MNRVTLVAMCWLAVAGCSHESAQAPTAKPAASTKRAPVAAANGDSVAAVALGALRVPVELRFTIAERPVVGQKLNVTLAVKSTEPSADLQLSAQGKDLALAPGTASTLLAFKQAGEEITHVLELTPQVAGLAEIEVHIKPADADQHVESVFAIPLLAQTAGG